jgi:hypothetical protein
MALLTNKFNPDGIRETLKNWYDSTEICRGDWVTWDGVSVARRASLRGVQKGERVVGSVSDLASVFGEEAHRSLEDFLNSDY